MDLDYMYQTVERSEGKFLVKKGKKCGVKEK